MEKAIIGVMMVVIMAGVMMSLTGGGAGNGAGNGAGTYMCPICGMGFSTESELDAHFQTHSSESIDIEWR